MELARHAIVEAVCHGRVLSLPPPAGRWAERAGVFVSLHRQGRLCGCIGQVESSDSLAATVVHCAIGAATKDPRFHPPHAEDLAELEIEISILSPPEPVQPEAIEIGRHGLVVSHGARRGVLLPHVAVAQGWTREQFLEETCAKAGLEPHAWEDHGVRLLAFTAEIFSEAELSVERQRQVG